MKSKKIITALLGLALFSTSFAAPVMAAENDDTGVQQSIIIQPYTSYNWTQTNIGVAGNSEAWFKGPAGNNYYFDTSAFLGYDGHLGFTWSGASSGASFTIYAESKETGDIYSSGPQAGTSGSADIIIPSNKVGDYKITIRNWNSTNLVINSMTLKTVY